MYCRLPLGYSSSRIALAALFPASPSNETTYLFPKWEFSRKSNVALLLQPTLHNFSALASVNHLDGVTYSPNRQKSRKSFVALLLPHVLALSPLLRYSYKKMGGTPSLPNRLNAFDPKGDISSPPASLYPVRQRAISLSESGPQGGI
jgi:hypothetical protein